MSARFHYSLFALVVFGAISAEGQNTKAPTGDVTLNSISPCDTSGQPHQHGKQDVAFKANISYGTSQPHTSHLITSTVIVTNSSGTVASQTRIIGYGDEGGGHNVDVPSVLVHALEPGTYLVQALLVHQQTGPTVAAPEVVGTKVCTFTLDP